MKFKLKNKVLENSLSVISLIYLGYLFLILLFAFLFDFIFPSAVGFFIVHLLINCAFLVPLYLTRKTKMTTISSMFMLLLVFLILICDFGNFVLVIPPFIVSVIVLFTSKAAETLKTIVGTVYLLIYVIGIFAFILVNSFFGSSVVLTDLSKGFADNSKISKVYSKDKVNEALKDNVSPDKKLRFKFVDLDNNLDGKLTIVVEPNNKDKSFGIFKLRETASTKDVGFVMKRGDANLPTVKWTGNNTISYQFPGGQPKNSTISDNDIKKDYFAFVTK